MLFLVIDEASSDNSLEIANALRLRTGTSDRAADGICRMHVFGLSQWRGLQRRQRQGRPRLWSPRSMGASVARRMRDEAIFYYWIRNGV